MSKSTQTSCFFMLARAEAVIPVRCQNQIGNNQQQYSNNSNQNSFYIHPPQLTT